VSFYVETWDLHAEKHAWDKTPATQEHIYQTIIDPDHAHRSLDDVIGHESCVFEKFFNPEQQIFYVPVLYEGVTAPGDYDQGGKQGKVLTGYFQSGLYPSSTIGEIFWSNPNLARGKPSK
jgi:hypothetical protein